MVQSYEKYSKLPNISQTFFCTQKGRFLLCTSFIGWGGLLDRMEGLGLSGGGSLKSTQKGRFLLCT